MRRAEPPQQVVHIRFAVQVRCFEDGPFGKPCVGNERDDVPDDVRRDTRGHVRVRLLQMGGEWQQHVILDTGKRVLAALQVIVPRVVEIERSAVIDELQAAVPDEEVRVVRRAPGRAVEGCSDNRRG